MIIKKDSVVIFFIISAVIGIAISYDTFYLFHASLICLLAFWGIIAVKNKLDLEIRRQPTKYHLFLYGMFIWYALTFLWSIDKTLTVTYLFYLICGIAITLTIVYYSTNMGKQGKLLKVMGVVFLIEIAISFLESFTNFRLPVSSLSNENLTPTGFRWNPNNLAIMMTMLMPFFLVHNKKYIKVLGTLATGTLVILAESRANVLAITVILLLYFFFTNKKRAILIGPLVAIALTVFIFVLAPIFENSENYKVRRAFSSFASVEKYITSDEHQSDSIGVRRLLIDRGIENLQSTYGIGIGGGASNALGEVYGISSMHNFWIELLVEGGILFFLAFALWYISILLKLGTIIRRGNRDLKYNAAALFLAMIGFVFGAVSASSVIYFFPMWIMFGLAISTINNYKRCQYSSKSEQNADYFNSE